MIALQNQFAGMLRMEGTQFDQMLVLYTCCSLLVNYQVDLLGQLFRLYNHYSGFRIVTFGELLEF